MRNVNKLNINDVRLGLFVSTADGEGCIESADRRKDLYGISINNDIRNLKHYKLNELFLTDASVSPAIIQNIGEFTLIFSKIEDRLQDFLFFVYDLKNTKQRILLIKEFSFSRAIDQVNDIVKDSLQKDNLNLKNWNSLYVVLKNISVKRNNIIHGSSFFFKDRIIFSNSKKFNKNTIDADNQVFDLKSLDELVELTNNNYYDLINLLNDLCEIVKEHICKPD